MRSDRNLDFLRFSSYLSELKANTDKALSLTKQCNAEFSTFMSNLNSLKYSEALKKYYTPYEFRVLITTIVNEYGPFKDSSEAKQLIENNSSLILNEVALETYNTIYKPIDLLRSEADILYNKLLGENSKPSTNKFILWVKGDTTASFYQKSVVKLAYAKSYCKLLFGYDGPTRIEPGMNIPFDEAKLKEWTSEISKEFVANDNNSKDVRMI